MLVVAEPSVLEGCSLIVALELSSGRMVKDQGYGVCLSRKIIGHLV